MHKRRIISALLIPQMLLLFTGCTETVWVGPEEVQPEQNLKGVETADGQKVTLPNTATLKGDTIYAYAHEDGLRFALEDLQRVEIRRLNTPGTVLLVAVSALSLFAIISWMTTPLFEWETNN